MRILHVHNYYSNLFTKAFSTFQKFCPRRHNINNLGGGGGSMLYDLTTNYSTSYCGTTTKQHTDAKQYPSPRVTTLSKPTTSLFTLQGYVPCACRGSSAPPRVTLHRSDDIWSRSVLINRDRPKALSSRHHFLYMQRNLSPRPFLVRET